MTPERITELWHQAVSDTSDGKEYSLQVFAHLIAEETARECEKLVCYHCRIGQPFDPGHTSWHITPSGYRTFCYATGIREAHSEAFR